MSTIDKGLITVLACAAVFVAAAIPLVLRKVPRNPVYGYRTRSTLGSDALWYEANAYFGVRLAVASVAAAAVAVALHQWAGLTPSASVRATVVLLVAPVALAWLLTARFVRSRRAGPGA